MHLKVHFKCISEKGVLIETKQPKGIQNNFNYGLSLLEQNEWGIFLSDDLIEAKKLENNKFIKCDIDFVLNELISILPKIKITLLIKRLNRILCVLTQL